MKNRILKNLLGGYLLLSLLLVQSFALAHAAVHMFHVEHQPQYQADYQLEKAETSASNLHLSQFVDQNSCDLWQLVSTKAFDLPTNFAVLSSEFTQPGLVIVEFSAHFNQFSRPFDSQAPPEIS